ncbi:MAG: glycosyltransferase family 39 protein [Candidatus Aminicenantes bacterium]|nr:glycosyltransferase family 39 protein [Candidatus Aminicenantes bacterium]
MKKLQVRLNSINESIIKNWFWLHIIFIAFYILYVSYKVIKGVNPIYSVIEKTFDFNLLSFIFIIIGFSLIEISFTFLKLKINWLYLIAFISYLLISFGYIATLDKGLNWKGSDVAWGNYNSAEEFNKFGIVPGIKDWNERANPYVGNQQSEFSDSIKRIIDKFNLRWLAFDKWKTNKIPKRYEAENNRPIMHPPLAPIALSLWLKLFPFGHWAAEIFMILLEFASIILIFVLIGKGLKNYNRISILLLALITTPVMIRFHDPSAEQLSMLLFLLSTYLIFDIQKSTLSRYFLSGLLIGLTFYTKFNIVFYIAIQLIFFIINRRRIKLKNITAYISGFLAIVCVFTILGYYFWLTFLTGFVYSKLYALQHPVTIVQGFSKVLYFGPSILLLLLLLILDFKEYRNKTILAPVLLSLVVTMIFLWDAGTWNRYLVFYLPVLFSFLLKSKCNIDLKTRDILIIPITNIIFITLNIYF